MLSDLLQVLMDLMLPRRFSLMSYYKMLENLLITIYLFIYSLIAVLAYDLHMYILRHRHPGLMN